MLNFHVLFFLVFTSPILAQAPLQTGVTENPKFSSGDSRTYSFFVPADRFAKLVISHRGVLLKLTLKRNDVLDIAWQGRAESLDSIEIAVATVGQYELMVQGGGRELQGSYKIEFQTLPLTDQNQQYVRAQRILLQGQSLDGQEGADNKRQAITRYQEALQIWRTMGAVEKEIEANLLVSRSYLYLGDLSQAQLLADEMLNKSKMAQVPKQKLYCLLTLAAIKSKNNQRTEAIQLGQEALRLSRQLSDRAAEAKSLNVICVGFSMSGQMAEANTYAEEELKVAQEIGNRNLEANALNTLAIYAEAMCDAERTIDHFERAIRLLEQLEESDGQAWVQLNFGMSLQSYGEYEKAKGYFRKSLQYYEATGRVAEKARALELLGDTDSLLTNLSTARVLIEQALALYRSVSHRNGEAGCLRKLAFLAARTGDEKQAEDFLLQSLTILRQANSPSELMRNLISLGKWAVRNERPSKEYFAEAYALAQQTGSTHDEVLALLPLSRAAIAEGQLEKANTMLVMLLPLAEKSKNRFAEAEAHSLQASLFLQQKQYAAARTEIERVLTLIEGMKGSLRSLERRAEFRSNMRSYYELLTDILVQGNFIEEAFESVERSRGRMMVEFLTEAKVDFRQGAERSLLGREKSLQHKIALIEEKLPRAPIKDVLEIEMIRLTDDLHEVQASLKRANPGYAQLHYPASLKVSEMQAALAPDVMLLEYALGAERSYLFAVTRNSMQVHLLPKRSELQRHVSQYTDLINQLSNLPAALDVVKRQARSRALQHKLAGVSVGLGQILFPGRLTKRLFIVPDDSLYQVSFATLKRQGRFVLEDHEIVSIPSVSAWLEARRQLKDRPSSTSTIAIFADPAFSGEMIATTRGASLYRLPQTRIEANAILAYVPANQGKVFFGTQANRENALHPRTEKYKILHFATHGIFDLGRPEKSGIVLSQVDKDGSPINGLITATDIFNLHLSAELVVLSGCQTARGKELHGEGMFGITRGFMYAGAKRVLSSLWAIDDRATARLMSLFYQGLLEQRLSPVAALRFAQLGMLKSQWDSPSHWGAFILQGDW